ncbi:MAG: cold shock domain-containing protein [Alphaproteobacteria bacterium]|nr:cold shock domain-containing protein [Alphaproteobacteria bacterium]MBQ8630688.1 cold shock domain-containing protein [Alphaproteobacteria bacterium]
MMVGRIKWFDVAKGYGFIIHEETKQEFFLHISQLEKIGFKYLKEGQKVSFDLYDDKGRVAAGNIKILY